jgi:hypothetical protein
MGMDIVTYNTGSVAGTVRKVHYWGRSLTCWWGACCHAWRWLGDLA